MELGDIQRHNIEPIKYIQKKWNELNPIEREKKMIKIEVQIQLFYSLVQNSKFLVLQFS